MQRGSSWDIPGDEGNLALVPKYPLNLFISLHPNPMAIRIPHLPPSWSPRAGLKSCPQQLEVSS